MSSVVYNTERRLSLDLHNLYWYDGKKNLQSKDSGYRVVSYDKLDLDNHYLVSIR